MECRQPTAVPQRQRLLLVADAFQLAYRVLRCARATGAEVYVLGNAGSTALRFSRHCARFFPSGCIIHGQRDPELALEINCLVREYGISLVLPADAPSTRSLIATRDLIEAPCFPLPSLAEFDLLNDKWAFASLCRKLAIRHPRSSLYADTDALRSSGDHCTRGQSSPGRQAAEQEWRGGIRAVRRDDTERRLRAISYQPILLQEFISGEPIGASVLMRPWKDRSVYRETPLPARVYRPFPTIRSTPMSRRSSFIARSPASTTSNMILAPDGAALTIWSAIRIFLLQDQLVHGGGCQFVEHASVAQRPRHASEGGLRQRAGTVSRGVAAIVPARTSYTARLGDGNLPVLGSCALPARETQAGGLRRAEARPARATSSAAPAAR